MRWNDRHSDRSHGNESEFVVLNFEWDPDNGDETGECRCEMANRKPPPSH